MLRGEEETTLLSSLSGRRKEASERYRQRKREAGSRRLEKR